MSIVMAEPVQTINVADCGEGNGTLSGKSENVYTGCDGESESSITNELGVVSSPSEAFEFNLSVLRKLKKAVESDPEVDLLSQIPLSYSARLAARKKKRREKSDRVELLSNLRDRRSIERPFIEDDIRSLFNQGDTVTILFPLSESVKTLLSSTKKPVDVSHTGNLDLHVSTRLMEILQQSDILWKGPSPRKRMVFKISSNTVVKIVRRIEDFTEYTSLQYLEKCKPNVPAPRPLGIARMSDSFLIFMAYLPAMTLGAAWTQLDAPQKMSIRDQLNYIFSDLRSLTCPNGMPLGGVAGEGCKDLRRNLRCSSNPITNAQEFEDFQFANPHYGSSTYIELLRRLSPQTSKCVFTHGDVRPDNIIVEFARDGQCYVRGLIDWENSGFYPEFFEATKATNCMATNEESDWYLFLPPCISPAQHSQKWLLDRLWGQHIE